jgi:hypothetical protein
MRGEEAAQKPMWLIGPASRALTNAERMNHWLAVLAENALLVTSTLEPARNTEG